MELSTRGQRGARGLLELSTRGQRGARGLLELSTRGQRGARGLLELPPTRGTRCLLRELPASPWARRAGSFLLVLGKPRTLCCREPLGHAF